MISIGDIDALFSLRDRYKKWRNPEPVVLSSAQRFITLFEAHGIKRGQIPRFFGHGITIHQAESDNELSKVLTPELIEAAATLFAVKPEWLEGATDESYELHNFYKQPEKFGKFIDSLGATTDGASRHGWLIVSSPSHDNYDALILLAEPIGSLFDTTIYRYHFCELWVYEYWKCRADIAACVAQAWLRNCSISGLKVTRDHFDKLSSLTVFPSAEPQLFDGERWHSEQLILQPQLFTQNLDDGEFGIQSALTRWLDYYQRSLMTSGFSDHSDAFKAAVERNKR